MATPFIHYFTAGEATAPVLLLLHGTGGNENSLLDLGRSLNPRSALLSPRGQILEHGMPRFFRRLAEGVFDEEDLIVRTHELAEFILSIRQEHGLDERPIVAVGYSNGANIAASLFLLRPEVLQGAVLLRAMVPLQPKKLPDLSQCTIFLAAGVHDPIIPSENTRRLAALFEEAGAQTTLHWTQGGHELHSEEINIAKSWLATHYGLAN